MLPLRAVGLWRSCLGFGDEREGVEYLGTRAAAGKQGHVNMGVLFLTSFCLRVTVLLENDRAVWGIEGNSSLRCGLRPLGGSTHKHLKEGAAESQHRCEAEQPVRAQAEEIHMLYGEEETGEQAETRCPTCQGVHIQEIPQNSKEKRIYDQIYAGRKPRPHEHCPLSHRRIG